VAKDEVRFRILGELAAEEQPLRLTLLLALIKFERFEWAIEKATGEKLVGPKVTIAIARAEGWIDKAGSKWKTIPEQMLRYRCAAWLINTVAPELSMGLPTTDEAEDIEGERLPDLPPMRPAAAMSAQPTLTDQAAPTLAAPAPQAPAAVTPATRLRAARPVKEITPEVATGVNPDEKVRRDHPEPAPASQAPDMPPPADDMGEWPEE